MKSPNLETTATNIDFSKIKVAKQSATGERERPIKK
jgi:hypothetical protein